MKTSSPKPDATPRPAKLHARLGLLVGLALGLTLSWLPQASASRNGSGTYSLPSGNPVVDGGIISSAWANNTLSDIATELTSSLDRSGRGAMLSQLKLSSGTAGAPGLAFSSETTSGLYRSASNDLALSIAGTARQHWTATTSTISADTTVNAATTNGNAVAAAANSGGWGNGLYCSGGNAVGDGGVGGNGILAYAGTYGTAGGYFVGGANTGTTAGGYGVFSAAYTNKGGIGTISYGGGVADGGTGGDGLRGYGGTGGTSGGVGGFCLGGTATTTGGVGLYGQGGPATTTGGVGVYGLGGTGATTGVGVVGSGNVGGSFSATTAATGGTRQDAVVLTNGDLDMDGVANPTKTTSINNRLTPMNLVKAWAVFDGASPCVIDEGFNVTSCTVSGNNIVLDVAQNFSSATYACLVNSDYAQEACGCSTTGGDQVTIGCSNVNTGLIWAISGTGHTYSVLMLGPQN